MCIGLDIAGPGLGGTGLRQPQFCVLRGQVYPPSLAAAGPGMLGVQSRHIMCTSWLVLNKNS